MNICSAFSALNYTKSTEFQCKLSSEECVQSTDMHVHLKNITDCNNQIQHRMVTQDPYGGPNVKQDQFTNVQSLVQSNHNKIFSWILKECES